MRSAASPSDGATDSRSPAPAQAGDKLAGAVNVAGEAAPGKPAAERRAAVKNEWNAHASAAANARTKLPAMAGRYFGQGRELAARNNATPKQLHAFRLATKQFRYTLELFKECYGHSLEDRLGQLKKVQQFLGEINDCAAAGRSVAAVVPKNDSQRSVIAKFLRDRTIAKIAQFRRHWRDKFDAPGEERRWRDYLERFARSH